VAFTSRSEELEGDVSEEVEVEVRIDSNAEPRPSMSLCDTLETMEEEGADGGQVIVVEVEDVM
jgi:hypothetical protein